MSNTATDQVTIYAEAARQALDALVTQRERLEQRLAREAFDAKHADHQSSRQAAASRYKQASELHDQLSDAIEAIETALLAN